LFNEIPAKRCNCLRWYRLLPSETDLLHDTPLCSDIVKAADR